MEIRERIAKIRSEKNISTYKLAEIMKNNGYTISQSTISKIENGGRSIDVDLLRGIANALNVDIGELLGTDTIERKIDLSFKESFYKFITDKRFLLDNKPNGYDSVDDYNKDFEDLYSATIKYIKFYCSDLDDN